MKDGDKTKLERALCARGLHTAVILSTDGPNIAWQIDNSTDYVDDVLGDWWIPREVGLYLFVGIGMWSVPEPTWQGGSEPQMEWSGSVRTVDNLELPELLAMVPPEEASEGREP